MLDAIAELDRADAQVLRAVAEVKRGQAENESLRAVLREWLALDESFTNCDFAFLREMVAKHHRLAPVVLKTRQLLDGDA
jgi:uncharacterized protein (DUF305 family)